MIKLENITKKYNEEVIKGISLKFDNKGLLCILGPSGSGKTTLLNIIGKLEEPTSGNVYYQNNNLKTIKDEYYHNYVISYIFQDYKLIKELGVRDNILLPIKLRKNKTNHNYYKILKILGIKNKSNKIVDYSGGEKQRIAIARTIISNAKIILADEPTGALDSKNSIKIMKILKKISRKKLVIIVTHNEQLAIKFSDRIIKIKDGKIENDSKKCDKEFFGKIPKKKTMMRNKDELKIVINNIKTKKKRFLMLILAFSIGLFSLLLALSLNNGFTRFLNKVYEQELYNFPLIINKKNNKIDDNKYPIKVSNNYNNMSFNKKDILTINKYQKNYLEGIIYQKNNMMFPKEVWIENPSNKYFDLLFGRYANNSNEIMLLVDENKEINEYVYTYLNDSKLDYETIVNKKVEINNQKLTITGIVQSNNIFYESVSGFLLDGSIIDGEIVSIYLFPKDYQSKQYLLKELQGFEVVDNTKEIVETTDVLIKGITIILLIFSAISLLVVTIIMTVLTYISVYEKQEEIGILKIFGTPSHNIKNIFTKENSFIAIISTIFSTIMLLITGKIINTIIYNKIGIESIIILNTKILSSVLSISMILSYISGIIPTKSIDKKRIIDTIKEK